MFAIAIVLVGIAGAYNVTVSITGYITMLATIVIMVGFNMYTKSVAPTYMNYMETLPLLATLGGVGYLISAIIEHRHDIQNGRVAEYYSMLTYIVLVLLCVQIWVLMYMSWLPPTLRLAYSCILALVNSVAIASLIMVVSMFVTDGFVPR